MSGLIASLCCCFSARDPHDQDDERTALLNPDIIPEAPSRPVGRSTQEQLQEQQHLRRILNEASERFINIISPSPFTRPSHHSRSPSPTPSSFDSASSIPLDSPRTRRSKHRQQSLTEGSGSGVERSRKISNVSTNTWRAPGEQEVKVVHLGTNFEPHERRRGGGEGQGAGGGGGPPKDRRPMSSHSLRTLPRGGGGGGPAGRSQPSPLGKNRGAANRGGGEASEGEEDGEEEEEEEDSRFATMASYRTAHEGSEELAGGTTIGRKSSSKGDHQTALGEIWRGQGAEEQSEELTQALKTLEESMSTFKLNPVGPIVADLGDLSA